MSDQSTNDETNMPAEENDAIDEFDGIHIPTSSMSIDDVPVQDPPVNDEPAAIHSGSSGPPHRMDYDTGECAICLSPHVGKSRLNCGHVFCYQCLVEWCRVKLECPTCRQPFVNFVHQTEGSTREEVYTPDPPRPAVPARNPVIVIRINLNNGAPLWDDENIRHLLELLFNPIPPRTTNNPPNPNNPSGDQV